MLARIDQGDAGLLQNPHGFLRLPGLEQGFDDFLQGAIVLRVRFEDLQGQSDRLIPTGIFEMEIQQEFRLLAAFLKVRDLLEELSGLREVALQGIRARANNQGGGIVGLEFQRFVGKLFAFRLVASGKGALGCRNIGFDGIASLAHGLVQIG